jgi:hypothetical protein
MILYLLRERGQLRRAILIGWFKVLLLGIFIGVVLGYAWHYKQVTGPHREEITRLTDRIEYYHNHWTPMRETPVRVRQK